MEKKAQNFKEALRAVLPPKEWGKAITSFDVLGKTALLEIPSALRKKRTQIGKALVSAHPYLESVYEKVGKHSGKFRVEKVSWICGAKNTRVTYREWGSVFTIDLGKAYFSPRLGTERQRIASAIRPNETIAVFFAGIGPYAVQIARHCVPKKVFALEWNPKAIPLLKENIAQNKAAHLITIFSGDVAKSVAHILGQCTRVIMPAPETAIQYLPAAVKALSPKGGIIHCYLFVERKKSTSVSVKKELSPHLPKNRPCFIVSVRSVSDFSASKVQVCAEIKVGKARALRSPKKSSKR